MDWIQMKRFRFCMRLCIWNHCNNDIQESFQCHATIGCLLLSSVWEIIHKILLLVVILQNLQGLFHADDNNIGYRWKDRLVHISCGSSCGETIDPKLLTNKSKLNFFFVKPQVQVKDLHQTSDRIINIYIYTRTHINLNVSRSDLVLSLGSSSPWSVKTMKWKKYVLLLG